MRTEVLYEFYIQIYNFPKIKIFPKEKDHCQLGPCPIQVKEEVGRRAVHSGSWTSVLMVQSVEVRGSGFTVAFCGVLGYSHEDTKEQNVFL